MGCRLQRCRVHVFALLFPQCPEQSLEPKTGPSCMLIHGWINVWVSPGTSYSKTDVELTRCRTLSSVIFVGYHTKVLQQPMLCCSVLSRLVLSNTLRPQGSLPGSSVHGDSLGKNIGMGCHPGDLPNAGIEPRSPALQTDSLPSELPGKPMNTGMSSLSLLQRSS